MFHEMVSLLDTAKKELAHIDGLNASLRSKFLLLLLFFCFVCFVLLPALVDQCCCVSVAETTPPSSVGASVNSNASPSAPASGSSTTAAAAPHIPSMPFFMPFCECPDTALAPAAGWPFVLYSCFAVHCNSGEQALL